MALSFLDRKDISAGDMELVNPVPPEKVIAELPEPLRSQ
jgi:hypothetical protein